MITTNGSPTLTLSEKAYIAIEDMIIQGTLAAGSYVTEKQIAELVGLGRTPVREAIQRLSHEHMVELQPRRGIHIPVLTFETELRILEVRRELDVVAVRLAAKRATEQQRQEMRELAMVLAQPGITLTKYAETVRETHRILAASANNTYLVESLLPLQNLSRRYWISHVTDAEAEIQTSSVCHLQMLRGSADGEPQTAEAAAYKLNDYLVDFAMRSVRLA